ncbi:Aspartate/alanine antiporter [Maioricimonas rarisocia]|uniref:Aspartate/alanine antiporter n=1 Tax=Maioricimonas rarisocia TaxID=2528026 RepID=A0A517YZV2_9PLAN|nr:TrkA C-terminal domain-containing protein [Maioricimonas rarisocia]QDU35757.1 Aspartate/alanine antiporter [Maioricimonas rarisocia]
MDWLPATIAEADATGIMVRLREPLLLLPLIMAVGMAIGAIRVAGLSLGASGVLFAALLFGHLGREAGWTLPDVIGQVGLVLFVYAVGLSAGPTFLRTFRDQGKNLALLAVVAAGVGGASAALLARLLGIPSDFAAGLFTGAMTSTPGLAAGIEAASATGNDPQAVSIGYGMAYPVGVVCTVLFVQLLPRLLRVDLDALGRQLKGSRPDGSQIGRRLVEIANPAIFGKTLHEIKPLQRRRVQITRVLEGDRLVPIPADHRLQQGQVVLLVAGEEDAEEFTLMLGRPSEQSAVMDAERDRSEVVVTSPAVLGKTLRELHLRGRFGVTISRVERYGMTFVPNAETSLASGDRVTAVGPQEGLRGFEQAAGHRVRRLHETDLMSLGIGLAAGVLIGTVPIAIPGLGEFTLGLAGGPLLSGLILAHFGRFLGVVGYMPLAARMFAQQLGLVLFLAVAGFQAGGRLTEMLHQYGAAPFLFAACVALVPMVAMYLLARFVFRMNLLEALGGTCGAMTSTAGVGALTSRTDSEIPVISYAAAYPAALVLMTVVAQLVVRLG